jgi:hypothetical protein
MRLLGRRTRRIHEWQDAHAHAHAHCAIYVLPSAVAPCASVRVAEIRADSITVFFFKKHPSSQIEIRRDPNPRDYV